MKSTCKLPAGFCTHPKEDCKSTPSGSLTRRSSTNTPDTLLSWPPGNCDRFFPRQRSRTNTHHPSGMRNWLATPGRGLQGPGRVAPCATSCAPEETFTRHNTHRQCPESDTTDPPMHRTWDPQQNARPSPKLCQWLGQCIRHPVACSLQLTVHRLGSVVPPGVWHLGKPSAPGERQTTHAERQPGSVHPRSTQLIRGWGSTKSHPYLLRAC